MTIPEKPTPPRISLVKEGSSITIPLVLVVAIALFILFLLLM